MKSMSAAPRSQLLVIDDDPAITRLLSELLKLSYPNEIALDATTDSSQARQRIESGCVDILLTDLEMPQINGLELLRFARQKNPCTQVIVLTGNSTQQALLEALEQGATDYLLKPLDRDQLTELVGQAHRRGFRWREALAETWRRKRDPLGARVPSTRPIAQFTQSPDTGSTECIPSPPTHVG